MFIPDAKVEEVRVAVDIVEVVGDYVRLKRRGSNFVGLCPFHNEKTPSFNVNPSLNIFKCFGCGLGGDVYNFIQRIEGVGFSESVRMLAERAGVVLPEEGPATERSTETESVYYALGFAARFFYEQLVQSEAGRPALDYLLGRGFAPQTIKKFGLGWAPDRWDGLLAAAQQHQLSPEVLEKAGLVIPRQGGGGHYDRYRGRVIFPIFSHVGRVLGFGGRILKDEKDQPKYINSPQTLVYDKSRVLYGLYQGKSPIRRHEEAILVEGYTDVIALHQAGVAHAVATSGTALAAEQVKMLSRYAKRVLLLYDADAAGANAALRGIDLVLEAGLAAYAIALPAGEDPDSFVRQHGGDAFRDYAEAHRQDFAAFTLEAARRAGTLDTPEGEAETMRAVVASIARMPDPLMQESYLRRASDVLGVPDIRLHEVLDEMRKAQRRQEARRSRRAEARAEEVARPSAPVPEGAPPPEEPEAALPEPLPEEKTLLRLMLEGGRSMVEFVLANMALDEFSPGPAREAVERFLEMYERGPVDTQRFLDGSVGEGVQRLVTEVLVDEYEPSENWQKRQNIAVPRLNEDPYESAASAMTLLKLDRIDEAVAAVRDRIYGTDPDSDALRDLQSQLMALHDLRKRVEARDFLEWNNA